MGEQAVADRIRIVEDCDGLGAPNEGAPALFRFGRGSELALLRSDERDFYKAAYNGRVLFVSKRCAIAVDGSPGAAHFVPGATAAQSVPCGTVVGRIRATADCDAFAGPSASGFPLFRFGAGSELPVLSDEAGFYRVSYYGREVYVPQVYAVALEGAASMPPLFVPPHPLPAFPSPPATQAGRAPWLVMALRIVSLLVGLSMVLSGVTMMILAGPTVLDVGSDVSTGYGLGIGGAVAAGIGVALVRLTFRPLAQFVLALSGTALVFGGIELLIFAIPATRMSDFELEADRAGVALGLAGAALIATGAVAIAVPLVRWLRNATSRARWPEVVRWSAIAFGGLLASSGPTIASVAALREQGYQPTLQDAAAIGATVPLALLPGAVLLFHGITISSQRLNAPFRFFPAGALFAVFGLAVVLGAIAVRSGEPALWLMTSAHALAGLAPAVALVALASRGGLRLRAPIAGLSHRQLWLALAVGIAVVTTVAGTLDSFIAQGLSTALLAANGAFDNLRTFEGVGDAMRTPDVYLSQGETIFLLLAIVAVMAPVMEEGFKAFGIALVLPRQPTPAVALTLGIAVGAGFGVTEASLYGVASLAPDSGIDWWAFMLIRAGATSMHALNTGLLGLALYFGRAERRYGRAFLLYLGAVGMHALWNTLAVLAGSRVIFEFESLSDRSLAILSFGILGALTVVVLTTLYVVIRRAYDASPKLPERAVPIEMRLAYEPWLG